jgi:hypothetical protein
MGRLRQIMDDGTYRYQSTCFMVPMGTKARGPMLMKGKQTVIRDDASLHERLLHAAFWVFREHGFAGASTLEIATRARSQSATSTRCSMASKLCWPPASPSVPVECAIP